MIYDPLRRYMAGALDFLREVLNADRVVAREEGRSLEDVSELPHVARPAISAKPLNDRGVDRHGGQVVFLGTGPNGVLGEARDEVPSASKRWKFDRRGAEAKT